MQARQLLVVPAEVMTSVLHPCILDLTRCIPPAAGLLILHAAAFLPRLHVQNLPRPFYLFYSPVHCLYYARPCSIPLVTSTNQIRGH